VLGIDDVDLNAAAERARIKVESKYVLPAPEWPKTPMLALAKRAHRRDRPGLARQWIGCVRLSVRRAAADPARATEKGDQRGRVEDAFALEPVDTDWSVASWPSNMRKVQGWSWQRMARAADST